LLSVIGYSVFLLIALAIFYKSSNPRIETIASKNVENKLVLREKSRQFSISKYASGLPDTPVILALYQNGNDAFYHQYKNLAESYSTINNITFIMANLNIADEMSVIEELRLKKTIQNFDLDAVPSVMFIYQNKEIEKLRMQLQFTNLGSQELKKRVDGMINFSLQQPKN
jgi:hypothetical protein